MFRPCIDIHDGKVKQIVGSTLEQDKLETNFISEYDASFYANLYKEDNLKGGHVIMLGKNNEQACLSALQAYQHGLQVGGGINLSNATYYLDYGASHVIITSFVFNDGMLHLDRLKQMVKLIGKDKLVLDLSCKKLDNSSYVVMTDRWQKQSSVILTEESLQNLSKYCDEFLIHAVDVEGKCEGIDTALIHHLAANSPIKTTYAGGAKSLDDLKKVDEISKGRVDLTIGSALDIFGGNLITYKDAVKYNQQNKYGYFFK